MLKVLVVVKAWSPQLLVTKPLDKLQSAFQVLLKATIAQPTYI